MAGKKRGVLWVTYGSGHANPTAPMGAKKHGCGTLCVRVVLEGLKTALRCGAGMEIQARRLGKSVGLTAVELAVGARDG